MVSAIIVAAGKGTRMGAQVDKLFLELDGCPIVAHTWRRFDEAGCIDEILLVVRDGMQTALAELSAKHQFRKPFRFVVGGKERQDSVWNGLEALSPETEIVAIQDAARPCTSQALIAATVAAAREAGAAVAAQPVTDTIKESRDGKLIERTLDRSRLWAVQTPQTFRVEIIRRALAQVRQRGLLVTDDTAACELIGQPVQLVISAEPNPKVTRPEDLAWVESLLRRAASDRNGSSSSVRRLRGALFGASDFGFLSDFGFRTSDLALLASLLRLAAPPSLPPLPTRLPPIMVWQLEILSIMKRRLIYGLVVTALSVNLLIGARLYLNTAQAAEKDSAYPSLELFSYVMEKVRKDYVDGQNLTYKDLVYAALKGMLSTLDPAQRIHGPGEVQGTPERHPGGLRRPGHRDRHEGQFHHGSRADGRHPRFPGGHSFRRPHHQD